MFKPLSAGELVFSTLPAADGTTATHTATNLLDAYQMLTARPSRLGDALAILLNLPPDSAESAFALRLKLFVFGQLGYQEDFDATFTRLKPGSSR